MQEVVRAASPRLDNSLYAATPSPTKKSTVMKRKTTKPTIQQPDMSFNKEHGNSISGGIFTSPEINRNVSFSVGKKRPTTSWKDLSRASYMQPTFSKQMLLARSGQISALVGTTT